MKFVVVCAICEITIRVVPASWWSSLDRTPDFRWSTPPMPWSPTAVVTTGMVFASAHAAMNGDSDDPDAAERFVDDVLGVTLASWVGLDSSSKPTPGPVDELTDILVDELMQAVGINFNPDSRSDAIQRPAPPLSICEQVKQVETPSKTASLVDVDPQPESAPVTRKRMRTRIPTWPLPTTSFANLVHVDELEEVFVANKKKKKKQPICSTPIGNPWCGAFCKLNRGHLGNCTELDQP